MNTSLLSDSFLPALAALQRVLEAFSQRGVIIGGIAASLLGEPRTTADIDGMILLSTDDLPRLLEVIDIGSIVTSQPKLDWERIRYWVQQFADALETPEIWTDIAHFAPKPSLLKAKPKSKRKK